MILEENVEGVATVPSVDDSSFVSVDERLELSRKDAVEEGESSRAVVLSYNLDEDGSCGCCPIDATANTKIDIL